MGWIEHGDASYIEMKNQDIAELRAKVAALEAENAEWAKWGIVEIAVRNPNVSAYMDHWEGRAVKAEAENGRMREALKSAAPVINCLDVYGRYLPVKYLIADALAQQPNPAQDKPKRERLNKGQCAAQVVDCDCIRCSPAQDKEQG